MAEYTNKHNAAFDAPEEPSRPPRKKRRKNSTGVYFLTFLICFLLLGGGVFVLLNEVIPISKNKSPQSSSSAAADAFKPEASQSMTVLAMGTAEPNSTAYAFLLLRYDAVGSIVTVVPLPWQMTATVNTTTDTLAGFYKVKGAEGAMNAAANATGVAISRYIVFDINSFKMLVDILGGVKYTVPNDLLYVNEETGLLISFRAGEQLLDGMMIANLFRYPEYKDGEAYRYRMEGEVLEQLINQSMQNSLVPILETSFKTIINLVDTNISAYDFSAREDALTYTLEHAKEIAVAIIPEGEFAKDTKTFALSKASKEEISAALTAAAE